MAFAALEQSMILDTSVVFTLLNRKDPKHHEIKKLLLSFPPPYFIATGTLAEIAYLLEQRLGFHALDAFLEDIESGIFQLEQSSNDLRRAHELARKYQNLPLGLADALVIACAEHRGGKVMSLDKHFFIVAGEGKIQVLT
jgi:uncharacterized protein